MAARLLSQSKTRATSTASQIAHQATAQCVRSRANLAPASRDIFCSAINSSSQSLFHSAHRHQTRSFTVINNGSGNSGDDKATQRGSMADDAVGKVSDVSAADILINALKKTPPTTPLQVLDRIAESRSINSSRYINAIIEFISELGENGSSTRFSPHLLNRAVCESLLDAIAKTETNSISQRIESRVIVKLCAIAAARGWAIDSAVLERVAIYLANNSFYGVTQGIHLVNTHSKISDSLSSADGRSMWQFRLTNLEAVNIPIAEIRSQGSAVLSPDQKLALDSFLADDPLDTAVDIARILRDRSFSASSGFYLFLLRAMSVRERKADAEWLFLMARQNDHRHLGSEYASMMSMYYRLGDPAAADALYSEFSAGWQQNWRSIESSIAMPDAVSMQAEKWRLVHEEHVLKPQVIEVEELWRIRNRAAAPFFRYALELVSRGHIDHAMALLGEAKYAHFVAMNSLQLGSLLHALLSRGHINQAYNLYMDFQCGENTAGGQGVEAKQVIFGGTPSGFITNDILLGLGAVDDWDRIWSVVGEGKALSQGAQYVDGVKWLLGRALSTQSRFHAVKCAQLLTSIASKNSAALDAMPATWIEPVLTRATELCAGSEFGSMHLVSELASGLLHGDVRTQGRVYSQWNARVIQCTLSVARRLSDLQLAERVRLELYAMIHKRGMVALTPVCKILRIEATSLFELLPSTLASVPNSPEAVSDGGWGSDRDVGAVASADSKFWDCAIGAFENRESTELGGAESAAHGLLLTIKLAFMSRAKLDPDLLSSANSALLESGYPIVDPASGDLLPRAEQVKAEKKHRADLQWLEDAAVATATAVPATGLKSASRNGNTAAKQLPPAAVVSQRVSSRGGSSTVAIKFDTPLQDKIRWYAACRQAGEAPLLQHLSWLVSDAMRQSKRTVWEPIVRDHMPKYLETLNTPEATSVAHAFPGATSLRTKYADTIWSHAIFAYSSLGEIDEAMDYFRRIIDAGGYPIAQATAILLNSLSTNDAPLPILPRGWDGPAARIFGMEAVYPPQGESSSDIVLVPSTAGQRKEMVAQMGLAMLYASLKHRAWPTTHFYSVLISALGHAGMISELRQVFEVIIPAVMRKLPPALRINPAFTPSPIIWTMAIREAAKSGDRVLAEYWFKEYRMSAMPIFREEASAYSRFVYRNQPKYARLFILGRPYYVVPQLRRALLDDGSVPEPWYDLREVEKQLEMDRLRALDKLPLSHLDAVRMMTIYATVDEHRDMESAELLADEIVALYQDSTVPKYSRPRGAADMALCWKLMVSGYLGVLRYQQQQIGYSASSVRKTKERLVYWYSEWSKAFKRANVHPDIPGHIRMALSKQEIGVIETIRRSIS